MHELYWLTLGFQVQIKVMVVVYEVLPGILYGYLWNHWSPVVSASHIQSGKANTYQVPSIKQCLLCHRPFPVEQSSHPTDKINYLYFASP